MGCNCSKTPYTAITDEEKYIEEAEKYLEIHKYKGNTLIQKFLSKIKTETVSKEQIQKILYFLKLNKKPHSKLYISLKGFGDAIMIESEISLIKVKCTIVLLAKDSYELKAKLLYEALESGNEINSKKLNILLDIISSSAIQLVQSAINFSPKGLSAGRGEIYSKKLKQSQPYFTEKLLSLILDGQNKIPKNKFIARISNSNTLKNILSTYGIRSLLLKYYPEALLLVPISQNPDIPNKNLKTSPRTTLVCKNSHVLKWTNDCPFYYMNTFGSWEIKCRKCNILFSSSCWHCRECSWDICEKCGLDCNQKAPKLLCMKDHELVWGLSNNDNFTCRICKIEGKDFEWNCKECNYSVCKNCGEKSGYKTTIWPNLCNNGHNLTIQTDIQAKYIKKYGKGPICEKCEIEIYEDCFHCNECDFDICKNCNEYTNRPLGPHPSFICTEGHYLRLFQSNSASICNSCSLQCNLKFYFCQICNFSFCLDCSLILYKNITKPLQKSCLKGHKLSYNPQVVKRYTNNEFICAVTKKPYKNIGSFSCYECSYDLSLISLNT